MRARRPTSLPLDLSLFEAAGLLRGAVDAASYRQVLVGLLFLRGAERAFADLPEEARWASLGRGPGLASRVDRALAALAPRVAGLEGVLPDGYTRLELGDERLSLLLDRLSAIEPDEGGASLAQAAERLLGRFAAREGRLGGDFYTPPAVARLMARLAGPARKAAYDPCCGAGGLLREAARASGPGLSLVGQEANPSTRRLCAMVLSLAGLGADLGPRAADTLVDDLHPRLEADVVLANPPFNVGGYGPGRLAGDGRLSLGPPPEGNANLAWLQIALARTAPEGRACVLLANGSSASRGSAERRIRRALLERGELEAMVALPPRLFYATPIGVTLWVLARGGRRARPGEVLFVEATSLGERVSRGQRALTDGDIERIAGAHRAFSRGEGGSPGFSAVARVEALLEGDASLDPARHVRPGDDAGEPVDGRIARLASELEGLLERGRELDRALAPGLEALRGGAR